MTRILLILTILVGTIPAAPAASYRPGVYERNYNGRSAPRHYRSGQRRYGYGVPTPVYVPIYPIYRQPVTYPRAYPIIGPMYGPTLWTP